MSASPPTAEKVQADLERIERNARTLQHVLTTPYPVAQTPKELVWTLNKARLYRYVPTRPAEQLHPIPLLLVFALMNRPSILDLRPGNSFVEFLVGKGYDVYLLDWGVPGPEDKDLKFDDYVLDYLARAVRKLKSVSGSDTYSLLGWCLGALVTTIYAALRPDGLRNLILLTAPLDFSDKQALSFARWTDERFFDVDKVVATFGNVPGELIDYGAKALTPVENYVTSYMRLWDNLDDPRIVESWHAMNTWVSDLVPLTGAFWRQLIVDFYRENRLFEGTLKIRGEQVDLANVRANLLNVIALGDHITPPCQSESLLGRVGSQDKQAFKVKGGHIGVMAGSGAAKGTWPQIEAWLAERSD